MAQPLVRDGQVTVSLGAMRVGLGQGLADYKFFKYPIECKLLHNLNFDDLADARDGEVAPATRADHDGAVGASLLVDTVFSVDPGSLDDESAVRIRTSFVGHTRRA